HFMPAKNYMVTDGTLLTKMLSLIMSLLNGTITVIRNFTGNLMSRTSGLNCCHIQRTSYFRQKLPLWQSLTQYANHCPIKMFDTAYDHTYSIYDNLNILSFRARSPVLREQQNTKS